MSLVLCDNWELMCRQSSLQCQLKARDVLEMTAGLLLVETRYSSTIRNPVTVVRKLGTVLSLFQWFSTFFKSRA